MPIRHVGSNAEIQRPGISGNTEERFRQSTWEHVIFQVEDAGKNTAIINDVKYEVNFGVPVLGPLAVADKFSDGGLLVTILQSGLNNQGEPNVTVADATGDAGDATGDAKPKRSRRNARNAGDAAGSPSGDADAAAPSAEAEAGPEAETSSDEAGTQEED